MEIKVSANAAIHVLGYALGKIDDSDLSDNEMAILKQE